MTTITEARAQILNKAATSSAFRARLLADPEAAIEEETGMNIPDGFSVKAHMDPASGVQLAVSSKAPLSDAELAAVVGGTGSNESEEDDWGDNFAQGLQEFADQQSNSEE